MMRFSILLRRNGSKLLYARRLCSESSKTCRVVSALLSQQPQSVHHTSRNGFLFNAGPSFKRYYSSLPSHKTVPLPALSPTMEMGTIVSWGKNEGDRLNEGDLLAEIETDKATMGFETPEEGFLARILVPAGTKNVPVGKIVCVIVESQEDVPAFKDFKDDGAAAPKAAPSPPSPEAPAAPAAAPAPSPVAPKAPAFAPVAAAVPTASAAGGLTPFAKRIAAERGVDPSTVKGSGLYGGITAADLASAAPAAAAVATAPASGTAGYRDEPVSNIRAVIAKRLTQSKQTIPHYYLSIECNVDEVLALRKQFNEQLAKEGVKLSVNDFIIKAAAMACRKVPEANSSWLGDTIRVYSDVDVSVAVSTDRGLITPIVFGADRKGVSEISADVKQLAARAREGKLKPHEFQGGTFSVSNLGMFGVSHFSAIINPPQACILAIGTTEKKLLPDEKSEQGFRVGSVLTVTMSCDHRVVDGAVGAQWLSHFRRNMEQPFSMLL